MSQRIILIGPCGAGKSTVGKILAEQMQIDFYDLDYLRQELYQETDYSENTAEFIYEEQGVFKWYEYSKPYEFYSVKCVLERVDNAVISFGGGQSVYDDTTWEMPFLKLMQKEPNIFLLLPSSDEAEALQILESRLDNEDEKKLNRIFIKSRTNQKVSKRIITGGRAPQEIADEIKELICFPVL